MAVKVEVCGMLYDSEAHDCVLVRRATQGGVFAFIKCKDLGHDGKLEGHYNYYWGFYDDAAPEESIKAIMERGGKWESLAHDLIGLLD